MKKKLFSLFVLTALLAGLLPAAVAAAPPPKKWGGKTYTVQKGDWLSKLAEKEYGDASAWPAIVYYTNLKAEEDKAYNAIMNPDVLEIGWTLYIPTAEEVANYESLATLKASKPTASLPPAVAGADFFAIGVEDLPGGWTRLREATNRSYCAWSSQWKLELQGDLQAQWPHCVELRIAGTGTVTFTVKPDTIGYATSDTLGTGLAWWPSGNGEYRVDAGKWVELTMGPEGVNFPLAGGTRTIEFRLDDGYAAVPLGEIRNNVLPRW